MDYSKLIELNKKVLDRAVIKIGEYDEKDIHDIESFEVLSLAIDNIKDLMKMEKHILEEDSPATVVYETTGEKTDFCKDVDKIMKKHGMEKGHKALMMILSEMMEDLKVLHTRMYDTTMLKLKGLE